MVIGVFALSSMILKPWAGWAMDWRGRRGILLAGAGLFTLASACYPATGSAASLLLVRIVHGAGMGLFPTAAVAMVADLAPAPRRGDGALDALEAAKSRDAGLTPAGLAWAISQVPLGRLADGLLAPLTLDELRRFRDQLVKALQLLAFPR